MKLTLPPLTFSDNEGFSSKDIFERKDFGERLANLIENSHENLVLALDARWGEGKSTFIKMWKGYIEHHRKNKIKSIYFDAFANDYQKDPFLSLSAEIYELLKAKSAAKKKKFKQKASKAIKSLARGALKVGVRVSTAGVLDGSIVDDVKEDISDLLAGQLDKVVADRLQNSEKDKSSLEEFKRYLEELASVEGGGRPLVFIVDELDRCRPDFALELIEQIKHLFSVKGIMFLLVLNKTQLEASIINRYGRNVNASIYLQKYINLWLTLPRRTDSPDHGSQYFKYVFNEMLEDDEKIRNKMAIQVLTDLVTVSQPSYREIEHILTYFALLYNMMNQSEYKEIYQIFIAYVCFIRAVRPQLIESIIKNTITADQLIKEVGLDRQGAETPFTIPQLVNYVKYDLADDNTRKDMIERMDISVHDYGRTGTRNIMEKICGWLADINIS